MIVTSFLVAVPLCIVVAAIIHGRLYVRSVNAAYPPTGQFLTIDGCRVHYEDLVPGTGVDPALAPLLLIHGVSSNLRDMKLTLGKHLAGRRRVVLIDRPGFGHSTRDGNEMSLGRQAAILDKFIANLGLERPIIVAHSYGGALALRLALDFPARARALILLAPVSHRWPGGVDWHNHTATTPWLGLLFRNTVIPLFGRFAARNAVREAFWPREMPDGYIERAGMALIFRPSAFQATAEDLTGLYDEVVMMERRYHRIKIPVRLLAGTHDTTVLSTIHCFGLKAVIEDSTIEYLTHAGHTLHHCCAAEVAAHVEALNGPV